MSILLTQTDDDLRDAVQQAVELAGRRGARARASAHQDGLAKVAMRDGDVETAERSGRQGLTLTVFHEGRRGLASTAALDREAIERVVEEALLIASKVHPDADADLPDADSLAWSGPSPQLFAEGDRAPDALLAVAQGMNVEAMRAAKDESSLRAGESVASAMEGRWAIATSEGFCRSSLYSNDARWTVMLAQDENGTTSDFCQSQERRSENLLSGEALAAIAANRARLGLGARSVASRRCSVLFVPRSAANLVGELAGALTGTAQYRRMSFLPDPIGRPVAAPHLDLEEDPFEPLGLASGPFDSEGICGWHRSVLREGVVEGLFLSSVTGRKLGMASTGNADSWYNLSLSSRATSGDYSDMLAMLATGLVVTQFQGGKTDPASGNWTQAIRGLWVEDGQVVHAVTDMTLAGSMPAMLTSIRAVGKDVERVGAIRTGSILIDDMQMGGRA